MLISIIIPVYNRPEEVRELLRSLTYQSNTEFEVIIVEDGSQTRCNTVVNEYSDKLHLTYIYKENGGPGSARNAGSKVAKGNYIVYLDSDCIVPSGYVSALKKGINELNPDVFGGPDKASADFSDMQKAVSYSMTSFFTTGGIRGGKKKISKFYPRSFNMGLSRQTFDATGGFSNMRFGEDIELSNRIMSMGFKSSLIIDAFVFHKRRTNLRSFFKQVFFSGAARINLFIRNHTLLSPIHLLPSIFTIFITGCIIGILFNPFWIIPPIAIATIWFLDSLRINHSVKVALLSVATATVQLVGYGSGFIYAAIARFIFKESEDMINQTKFY